MDSGLGQLNIVKLVESQDTQFIKKLFLCISKSI